MKKIECLLLALALCFSLTACRTGEPEKKEMPDAMKELAQNENVEWMAGMWVEVTNCEMLSSQSQESFEVYAAPDGAVQANVTLQNGLDKRQPFFLMVLADGLPVEFSIDGESYLSYPLRLTSEQIVLPVTLRPEFSLQLGRLDFMLCFDGDPQADFHTNSYTLWFDLEAEAEKPTLLQTTIAQREGLQGSYHDGTYGAWLWNQGVQPAGTDTIGAKTMTVADGERLLLEVIAAKEGLYRTILILDGMPVSFETDGTRYSCLDWKSGGTDMLQIPIEWTKETEENGSFFTVSTPLDPELTASLCLVSGGIQISAVGNGEE